MATMGVVISFCTAIGGMLAYPVISAMGDLKVFVAAISERMVTQAEMKCRTNRGLEDRAHRCVHEGHQGQSRAADRAGSGVRQCLRFQLTSRRILLDNLSAVSPMNSAPTPKERRYPLSTSRSLYPSKYAARIHSTHCRTGL